MALQELESPEAVDSFLKAHHNVVLCFSATWCGPCKAIKPQYVAMAEEYASKTGGATVKFAIAYEHNLGDAVGTKFAIRAFPSFVLFVQAQEVDRVEGGNLTAVRTMITEKAACADVVMGEGHSLGGGGGALSLQEARAQRLAKLGGNTTPAAAAADSEDSKPAAEQKEPEKMDVDQNQATKEEEVKDVEMEAAAPAAETEDPTANLDKEALESLTQSMGFSLLRSQKGLLYGTGGVEGAVEWLMQHQEDDDIDEPIKAKPADAAGAVAQSYKCNDCGKVLADMVHLELHANKTGHSDFEESTAQLKPMTPEEKAAKVAEIKALVKAKRAEREESEKNDEIEREKQRRNMGKEMAKTREQMEKEQRLREAKLIKKQKQEAKKERERIRAELAKDKAERKAHHGKLSSRLGVEGYNPSAIQYDAAGEEGADTPSETPPKKAKKASVARIDEYIDKVKSYRAGGDGATCLKVLLAYVGNVVDKPDEAKFRTINMENKAFKSKVKPFLGAKNILLAVGFSPIEGGDALVLEDDADRSILEETRAKLQTAYANY